MHNIKMSEEVDTMRTPQVLIRLTRSPIFWIVSVEGTLQIEIRPLDFDHGNMSAGKTLAKCFEL